jgi:hypothetical protein
MNDDNTRAILEALEEIFSGVDPIALDKAVDGDVLAEATRKEEVDHHDPLEEETLP